MPSRTTPPCPNCGQPLREQWGSFPMGEATNLDTGEVHPPSDVPLLDGYDCEQCDTSCSVEDIVRNHLSGGPDRVRRVDRDYVFERGGFSVPGGAIDALRGEAIDVVSVEEYGVQAGEEVRLIGNG